MNWFKKFWKSLTTPMPKVSDKPAISPPHRSPVRPSAQLEENLGSFTARAQQVLALSRKEAGRFNHNFVGTEHLLLGLLVLGGGVAANVLLKLGLDLETVRKEVEKLLGKAPDQKMTGAIPFTPQVKKVLVLASQEAKSLNHTYIGTEHILLGILREGDGAAASVLRNLNADVEKMREEILRELTPSNTTKSETESAQPTTHSVHQIPNFTPHAQQVLAFARKEADRFNHNFVGTEHLLLGIVKLGKGTAVTVLQRMGLDLETICEEVEKQVGKGPDQKMIGNIPYTPRVKKVLALAAKEAKSLNHTYVGTGHILLGLLREGDGVAARVLRNLDVDIETTRQEILKESDPNKPTVPETVQSTKPKVMTTKSYEPIDTSLRYDVYCREREKIVVYRNALFKSVRSLFPPKNEHVSTLDFVELEQSSGQTIFISRLSLVRFCPHGVKVEGEDLSGDKSV